MASKQGLIEVHAKTSGAVGPAGPLIDVGDDWWALGWRRREKDLVEQGGAAHVLAPEPSVLHQ